MTEESDDRWLAQAANGDGHALAALLRKYGPQVRQRITRRTPKHFRSAFDEDDVMQVTYLEAFLRIDRFSPAGGGTFLAWLTEIAQNNLRDAVKELKRAKRPPRERQLHDQPQDDSYVTLLKTLGGTMTTPSRDAAGREAKRILDHAIRLLPPDYRTVVRLSEIECRSASQVARVMQRSVGAVYMLRARALDRLRRLLPSESGFFSTSR